MFKYYISIALRSFKRNPVSTVIKLAALSLGLACFLLAHLVADYVHQTDRGWAAADRIYTLTQEVTRPNGDVITGTIGAISTSAVKYLHADFNDLKIAATRTMTFPFKAGDHIIDNGNTLAVEPEFLDIFDLTMKRGRAEGALDAPRSALVEAGLARELFGSEDVVGKSIELQNGVAVTVTGVFTFDAPTHLGSEAVGKNIRLIIRLDTLGALFATKAPDGSMQPPAWLDAPNWVGTCCTTYLELPADGSVSRADLEARLQDFSARRVPSEIGSMRFIPTSMPEIATTYMNTRLFGGGFGLDLPTVLTAFAALVLAVACLDFANLATAEAAVRAKEVGLRKTVGASRRQIAVQTLLETGLLAFGALVLVLPVTYLLAAPLGQMIGLNIGARIFGQPDYWLSVVAIVAGTAVIAGAYPALVLSRVRPIFALRMGGSREGSPLVRMTLIGAQFAAASFLIVAVVVMLSQKSEIQGRLEDPSADPRVTITLPNDGSVDPRTLRTALLADPSVTGVAVSNTQPFRRSPYSTRGGDPEFGTSEDPGSRRVPAQVRYVSPGYFKTAGIALVAGQEVGADAELSKSNLTVVIDTQMAADLGLTPQQAVGGTVYYLPRGTSPGQTAPTLPARVVGVAAATPLEYMTGGPSGYVYVTQANVGLGAVIVRIARGDVKRALAHIDAAWAELAPGRPIRRMFLDEAFDTAFAMFNMMNTAFVAMSVVAAVIAAIGMFGVAGFIVERRRHEIGVRKTLGATAGRVLRLLLWSFAKPIVVANLIAWPLAYAAAQAYLSLFVNRIALTPVPFVVALVVTLGLAWIAVGVHTVRAARLKPAAVLRYE